MTTQPTLLTRSTVWLGYIHPLILVVACGGLTDIPADEDVGQDATPLGGSGSTDSSRGGGATTGFATNHGTSHTATTWGGAAQTSVTAKGGTTSLGSYTPRPTCDTFGNCNALPQNCDAKPSPHCITSCFAESSGSVSPICHRGNWTCPDDSISKALCPVNSCATSSRRCCNSTTGVVTWAGCTESGYGEACPLGTKPSTAPCMPEGIQVESCFRLEQTSCAISGHHCDSGWSFCDCEANRVTGQLTWSCQELLIIL